MNVKLLAVILGAVAILGATTFLVMRMHHVPMVLEAAGISPEVVQAFKEFSKLYKKYYSNKDIANYRLRIFSENFHHIEEANRNPLNTYKSGVNQFSDMSLEEFRKIILMRDLPTPTWSQTYYAPEGQELAANVDWRTKGAVTPVKNQGSCGSCWSFSTTGALEGSSKLQDKKNLQSFSEQQLVDCCGKDGFQCQGCSGAWPEWALNWVKAKGIASEAQYPYVGVEGACTKDMGDFHISSYSMIGAGKEADVISAVNNQPVSICVDASTWFSYSSGVFNGCNTTPQLDHAVLIVGYTDQYYIVKNSWDTTWGESGFIRLPKNANACGLANHAITTTI